MSLVKINWRPDRKDLRDFGITVFVGFLIVGGILFLRNHVAACWTWGIGTFIGGIGFTGHKIVLPFYWAWMSVAFVMGNIMSHIIMTLVYVAGVTPLAFLMRLTGRDRLCLRRKNKKSYWMDIKPHLSGREKYERQF